MQESQENYLETIYMLLLENKEAIRSVDIANTLNYSKASVSRAMKILKENGYILFNENNTISLTEKGLNKAKAIYERHQVITSFLVQTLGIDQTLAEQDACRIEHIISEETFQKMKCKMEGKND